MRHPSAWAVLTAKDTGGEQQRDPAHAAQELERAFVIVHAEAGSGLTGPAPAFSMAVEGAGVAGATATGAALGLGSDPPQATRETPTTTERQRFIRPGG